MKRLLIAALAVVSLGACANATEEFNDAPVGHKNDDPADIYSMPDGFSNVATKCIEGNRVFSTRNEAGIAVAPNDPTCQEGNG